MGENKYNISFSEYEQGLMLNALICMKNELIRDDKLTESVDELLIKIGRAPAKKRFSERTGVYER